MSTVKQILNDTLELSGVLGIGKKASGALLKTTLRAMNLMLQSWSAGSQTIWVETVHELTLTANKTSYTIGDGGDFDTTRPQRVFDSYLRITDTDFPVRHISRDQYDMIVEKDETGIPGKVYYSPSYPLGVLYFYAVPREAYTLFLVTFGTFPTYTMVDSFSTLPPGYERAIKFNLAIEIAGNYGRKVTPVTATLARQAMQILVNTNLARQTGVLKGLDPTGGSRGHVNPEELFT